MNTPTYQVGESFEFALPDAGSGGETHTAADLAASHDYVVTVLLRDHYCPLSRQYVQSLAEAYEAFAGRSTAVVPVLPDRRGRAAVWQRRYELPFGLLTDPVEEDDADGFESFAPIQRLLPKLPGAVLFETDGERLRFARTIRYERSGNGPAASALLEAIDDHATDSVVESVGPVPDVETVSDG